MYASEKLLPILSRPDLYSSRYALKNTVFFQNRQPGFSVAGEYSVLGVLPVK
jgi:hypothetical protein